MHGDLNFERRVISHVGRAAQVEVWYEEYVLGLTYNSHCLTA
jgi:hypothetical protein